MTPNPNPNPNANVTSATTTTAAGGTADQTTKIQRDQVLFYVNGQRIELHKKFPHVDPHTPLLQFLRDSLRLTGTKLGCGEGGCGACTVTVSQMDPETRHIQHFSTNACLTPVAAIDGCMVTTVEGVGGIAHDGKDARGLHPVQEAIAETHGSQCGYCTPGFVMSMFTFTKQREAGEHVTMQDIEHGLDGNLCRCTGYRPILDAAKSFGVDATKKTCKGSGTCGNCANCPNKNKKQHDHGQHEQDASDHDHDHHDMEDLYKGQESSGSTKISTCSSKKIREMAKKWESKLKFETQQNGQATFPPDLQAHVLARQSLEFHGPEVEWFAPASLQELLALKKKHPNAKLVVGNTELGIEIKFKKSFWSQFVHVNRVSELQVLEQVQPEDAINTDPSLRGGDRDQRARFEGVRIGAALTLSQVKRQLSQLIKSLPSHQSRSLASIVQMLAWFANNQVRNVACIAGNLVTASPISDLNPLLASMNALVELQATGRTRLCSVRDFFVGYRRVDMQPDEVITAVYVPFSREYEFILPFKQSKRREDDISIVSGGIRMELNSDVDGWRIANASLVFGGMAPTTKAAAETERFLTDKPFTSETIDAACDVLYTKDFTLPDGVPGGMARYRESLCGSFLFKFFVATAKRLAEATASSASLCASAPVIADNIQSAGESYMTTTRPSSNGVQHFSRDSGGLTDSKDQTTNESVRAPVGEPVMHKSAYVQATGEAQYTDDVPTPTGALHGAFVLSTIAHGLLKRVDASKVLEMEGVHGFFDASSFEKYKLGSNQMGDEECFASKEVLCVGQPIGIVVAESHELANKAAHKVVVEYEVLPSIVSIQDALEANSFFDILPRVVMSGDLEKTFDEADVVIEGEMKIGGQEHFYIETHVSLCNPVEGGMHVLCSSQGVSGNQAKVSGVLGIDSTRVVCKTKRAGGAFGGKETKAGFIACAASVAAFVLKKPVKMMLERHVDMVATGGRHPYLGKYKLGAKDDGTLVALDIELFSNGGYSLDMSQFVMDRAVLHCVNSYRIPNVKVVGKVCKTHTPSNTAFRGFGGPQALMVAESYMDHLARVLNMEPEDLRTKNMLHQGDKTHYLQPLENFHLPSMWQKIRQKSCFDAKKQQVADFNSSHRFVKRGVVMMPVTFGVSFTSTLANQGGAIVHVYTDGSVLVSHGGVEMGQGLHTKCIQVAAKAFGISTDKVHIDETSTDKVPNSMASAASMSTDLYGMATLNACEQIVNRLKPVRARFPDKSFAEIALIAHLERVNLSAQGFYGTPGHRCGYDFTLTAEQNAARSRAFNYFTTGVAVTCAELDILTGDYHLQSVDLLMDLGSSLNPTIDIGQIEGAFLQGFGLFTMEELVWGDDDNKWVKRGDLFSRGPGVYKIPSPNDVPLEFNVWLESDVKNPFAIHSSRGVGEPPLFLGASGYFAIKEAIYAARKDAGLEGFFDLRSPVTSERARMACGDPLLQKLLKLREQEANAV